jgi:hypothetical protein
MKRPQHVTLPVSVHPNAIAQARAFATVARSIASSITLTSGQHPQLLAYLANAGLAIELHLKSLMIVARGGRIPKEHDLAKIYAEFPEFFTRFLDWQYTQLMPQEGWTIQLTALTQRGSPPQPPSSTPLPKYGTFEDAIQSSSRAFEDGRYFFERVHQKDWVVFAYAPGPIDAVLTSLVRAYEHLLDGDFEAKKPSEPQAHAA